MYGTVISGYSCNTTANIAYASSWPIALLILFYCHAIISTRVNQFLIWIKLYQYTVYLYKLINGGLGWKARLLSLLTSVLSFPLSNKLEAFLRLAGASLRSFWGGDQDVGSAIGFHTIFSHQCYGNPLKSPSCSSRSKKFQRPQIKKAMVGKGALVGRELWIRLSNPTLLI